MVRFTAPEISVTVNSGMLPGAESRADSGGEAASCMSPIYATHRLL